MPLAPRGRGFWRSQRDGLARALVLGIVQGLTEFLPVSSDGHLKITQDIFDYVRGRTSVVSENLFFDIMLHLGTLAAIVLHHRAVVKTGAGASRFDERRPGLPASLRHSRRPACVRGDAAAGSRLALFQAADRAGVSEPASHRSWLPDHCDGPGLTLRFKEGTKGPAETEMDRRPHGRPVQALAPLPGVSRSALTVAMRWRWGFRGHGRWGSAC